MDPKRVLVIGAGFAGLSAAWRLAERGVAVQLVEKRVRLGGSVFRIEAEGFAFESRPYEICATDHALAAWLGELGLPGEWLPQHRFATAMLARGAVAQVDPDSVLGIARIPGVSTGEALRMLRLPRLMRRYATNLTRFAPERAAAHDDRSLQDFISTYFGSNVFENWALPWLSSYTNCDAYHTSRVLFLREFASRMQASSAELRSGTDVLVRAVAKRIPILPDTEVSRIERLFDGSYRAHLRCGDSGAVETAIEAQAVICATGAATALQLLNSELGFFEKRCLQTTKALPRATAYFGLDRTFDISRQRIFVSRHASDLVGTIFLESDIAGERIPDGCGVVAVCLRAEWLQKNAHQSDAEILDAVASHLQPLFPSLAHATQVRALLRLPEGSTQFPVGRYRELAQWQRILVDRRRAGRRVYLAGDYLCGPLLEDALISGIRAADALLEDRDLASASLCAAPQANDAMRI